ncbi:MAG: 50S ribosomal protein L30e [Desulfurococcales archaeon]|nr:50S ribosomal protein L30e [Desulfurococcales archaeon]
MSLSVSDFARELQMVLKTGSVVLGSKKALKLVKLGKAKLIIVSLNAPPEVKKDLKYYCKLSNIPLYVFPGTNVELGAICGKPFSVAAMAIIDPGQSNIIDLIKETEVR